MNFNSIEEAIEDIKQGKIVIVVDDEDRENEGDLVVAAEKITPDHINFMTKFGRGLVCLPITRKRAEELSIPLMIKDADNTEATRCKFTVSIDFKKTSTGISANDRAATVKAVLDPTSNQTDFFRPGHIFPLIAEDGGVLRRVGHTEASVDLARLAGLSPAGVICEIMKENGEMARVPDLMEFKEKYRLKIITIADLVEYRSRREKLIERIVSVKLPVPEGDFDLVTYKNKLTNEHHMALVKGNVRGKDDILVRVHSECITGEAFGSLRCDCGYQLKAALRKISEEGCGVLLYMRQEGRGMGFVNKMHAYALQDKGLDTVEANVKLGFKPDLRDYGIGAQILADLGITSMRLLTNNPRKISGIKGYGLNVTERIPLVVSPNEYNKNYLQTKKQKLGHIF